VLCIESRYLVCTLSLGIRPKMRQGDVRGCGQERLPDHSRVTCFVCLPAAVPLFIWPSNAIDSKMRTILYGRQLAVSWCTSRVNFDAGLNHCRPPAARLPLRIGRSDQITGGLNVCSVRGCKGTHPTSWMSWLARRSTGTDGQMEAYWRHVLREGGVCRPRVGQCLMLWAASASLVVRVLRQCAATCASDAIARQPCGATP